MTDVIKILQAMDAIFAVAISAGIRIERFNELKAANGGEPLTQDQLDELAADAQRAVDRL